MKCRKCKEEIPDVSKFCMFCGASQESKKKSIKHRGNGQGTVYKMRNGKYRASVVLAMYRDENGKLKRKTASKVFVKKSDAIAALPGLKATKPEIVDMSLHDLHEAYTDGKEFDALSKSQRDKLGIAWRRLAPIEFAMISTLTVDDLQTVIDGATSTYYPARDMKVLLSHLYRIAIRKEIVMHNKSEYIDLPDAPKAKRECWTKDEVAALWKDYETNAFTGYILIMCYAGLRYGEIATIQLENIHLAENYMIGGIKTEAGINREIPIHKRIKPIIERFVSQRRKKLLEMNEDNFYDAYWTTIRRTGLRERPPQTCRHFYFSSMTAAGIEGGIIAETGGHASYLTTMKNYVRIPLEDKLDAVNRIE